VRDATGSEPPPAAIEATAANSTSVFFSSQTRAAPNCTKVPGNSPFRLLKPSRQLAGIRAPAAAAGQGLSSLCLRLLSKLMGPVASPLSHTEALCVVYCSAGPFPSPDFAPPRPCCPGGAAAARRRPL
jgi:hypothetical protein